MTINNPLADNSPDHEDQSLALRARSGDHQALQDLVQRHTKSFSLIDCISVGVDRMQRNFEPMRKQVEA